MQREQLVAALDSAADALAEGEETVMGHYWFDGTHLSAYNDQIAIRVPLATEFTGAVPRTLATLLSHSRAPEVKLTPEREHLLVLAGGGKFKLPMLDASAFADLFEMPDSARARLSGEQCADLRDALACCAMSVSDDIARPEYLGVTVGPEDGRLSCYATNGKTMSKAWLDLDGWPQLNAPVLLPSLWCRVAARLTDTAASVEIGVHPDHVLLVVDGVYLFGRLIDNARPLNYPQIFDTHFPADRRGDLIEVPRLLRAVMARALVLTKGVGDGGRSRFVVRARTLEVRSISARGDGQDRLKLAHPDVEMTTDPKLVLAALDRYDRMLFTPGCIVLSNEADQYHLIAATS